MSIVIDVPLACAAYPIHLGSGLGPIGLAERLSGREVVLVSDTNVALQPWFAAWRDALSTRAAKFHLAIVPAGESSKSLEQFGSLCSALAAQAFSRRVAVVALGGGVVGDLAGFLAAAWLRGVDLVQVPTTLLAMVDSSVGGKTGVNLPEGKNLVGAFHQPTLVWADLDLLNSLPSREFSAGLAEVVKYGMISDPGIFDLLEEGIPSDMVPLVARCIEIKRDVVVDDERELSGGRAVLNFGHTIGHAIEQTSGYGSFLHGEAVSLGMLAACALSEARCGLDPAVTRRLKALLRRLALPVAAPGLNFKTLAPVIARDKKSTGSGIRWVLCPAPGRTILDEGVGDELVATAVDSLAPDANETPQPGGISA